MVVPALQRARVQILQEVAARECRHPAELDERQLVWIRPARDCLLRRALDRMRVRVPVLDHPFLFPVETRSVEEDSPSSVGQEW